MRPSQRSPLNQFRENPKLARRAGHRIIRRALDFKLEVVENGLDFIGEGIHRVFPNQVHHVIRGESLAAQSEVNGREVCREQVGDETPVLPPDSGHDETARAIRFNENGGNVGVIVDNALVESRMKGGNRQEHGLDGHDVDEAIFRGEVAGEKGESFVVHSEIRLQVTGKKVNQELQKSFRGLLREF